MLCLGPHDYLTELHLKHTLCKENDSRLLISPFVLVHMLCVLSNYKLGNMTQCLETVTELQGLLQYDDERYVDLQSRDISWQILGICQQIVGNLKGALLSFKESLRQRSYHETKIAAETRIGLVLQQLKNM